MLDDLGSLGRGLQNRRKIGGGPMARNGIGALVVTAGSERLVNGGQEGRRGFPVGAKKETGRVEKILDRGAFAKEFGVRRYVEEGSRNTIPFNRASNPVIGVNRHRALLHDDLVGVDGTGDLAGHSVDIRKISVAGFA